MLHSTFPIIAERACDGCTRCCEGWLTGIAYGYEFYPGKKCHFLSSKNCTIYPIRPDNPCKTFQCQWKENLWKRNYQRKSFSYTKRPSWNKPKRNFCSWQTENNCEPSAWNHSHFFHSLCIHAR